MLKDTLSQAEKQEAWEKSREILALCIQFLTPLLAQLSQQLDMRLVNTFVDLVQLIVIHRDRHQGLILSELGGETAGEPVADRAMEGAADRSGVVEAGRWESRAVELFG